MEPTTNNQDPPPLNESEIDDAFASIAQDLKVPPLALTAQESEILDLYDQIQELRLENALMDAQISQAKGTRATTNLLPDPIAPKLQALTPLSLYSKPKCRGRPIPPPSRRRRQPRCPRRLPPKREHSQERRASRSASQSDPLRRQRQSAGKVPPSNFLFPPISLPQTPPPPS